MYTHESSENVRYKMGVVLTFKAEYKLTKTFHISNLGLVFFRIHEPMIYQFQCLYSDVGQLKLRFAI